MHHTNIGPLDINIKAETNQLIIQTFIVSVSKSRVSMYPFPKYATAAAPWSKKIS